jgi:hypothetical protein
MALFRPESLQKSDYNHLKPQTTDILFANMGTSKDPKKHLKKKTQKIHSFPQFSPGFSAPPSSQPPRNATRRRVPASHQAAAAAARQGLGGRRHQLRGHAAWESSTVEDSDRIQRQSSRMICM